MAIIVNGERIEDAAVQAEAMRLRRAGSPPENVDERARQNLTDQAIVRQNAMKAALPVSDSDIEAEIMRTFAQYGGKDPFFSRHGLTEEDEPRFREQVIMNLRVQTFVGHICEDVPQPTDEDVRNYFDEHPDQFIEPAKIRASHIVKRPSGPEDEETFTAMVDARRRLLNGEEFAILAEEFSDCSSEPGGDLGFFPKGHMVPEFEIIVFSMDVGEISPVFTTQFGYHIAKVFEKSEPRQQEFEEVAMDLMNRLADERKDKAFTEYLVSERKAADVIVIAETAGKAESNSATSPTKEKAKRSKKGKKGKRA